MNRRSVAAVLLMVVCLVASACGRDRPTSVAGDASTTSSTAAPSTTAAGGGDGSAATTGTSGGVATGAPQASVKPPTGQAPAATSGTAAPPAATAAASNPCGAAAVHVEPRADRPVYDLDLVVDLAANAVHGRTEVRFTPDIATDRLAFRLWPNGPRASQAGAKLDVGTSTVDGHGVAAAVTDRTTLVLRPEGGVAARDTVKAAVDWRITLPGQVNDRISRTGESVRLGSFFPILAWEPGVGWATEPPTGGFAEASTAPTADFTVHVRGLPAGLTALVSGEYKGAGTWDAPAVRDVALSIGRFTLAGATVNAPHPVHITVGVAAGIRESPATYLERLKKILPAHAARFGAYPWSSYTLAITPGLAGGIEYPGHVQQGPGTIGRTTSHEAGHMWFYGLVGNDQGRDPWLDEGLASWAEARYEGSLGRMTSTSIPADARGHLGDPMTYWDRHNGSYYRGVYVQGVQALSALGPADRVDCALRNYVARSAHTIATTAALRDALRPTFPNVDQTFARYGAHA